MICYLRYFVLFVLSVFLTISPLLQVVSFADINHLMINTDSNALLTLNLDDDDYSTSLMSSLGSVVNTVDLSQVFFSFWVINPDTGLGYNIVKMGTVGDNNISVKLLDSDILDGYYLSNIGMHLKNGDRNALPPSGRYKFSFDLSNQFSYSLNQALISVTKSINNAETVNQTDDITSYTDFSSGEAYCSGVVVDLKNVSSFYVGLRVQDYHLQRVRYLDGDASFRFELTYESTDVTVGIEQNSQDYQNDVSGSLSDLSSSVDSVEEEISLVTQAIQTLQGAMEPHYNNVLTQLHHITEQLHAFYDQVYNNIHLPELAKMDEIIDAISNIDIEFQIDFDELKSSINNMSTAVQNKLQSTTDQITNGYDNTQQTQQNQQLQDSINAYDEVEQDIFEDVDGFMQEFEYPSFDTMDGSVIRALAFVGSFLQSIFLCMGDFSTIITFSLTMIFVMVIVGYHRIRS